MTNAMLTTQISHELQFPRQPHKLMNRTNLNNFEPVTISQVCGTTSSTHRNRLKLGKSISELRGTLRYRGKAPHNKARTKSRLTALRSPMQPPLPSTNKTNFIPAATGQVRDKVSHNLTNPSQANTLCLEPLALDDVQHQEGRVVNKQN